MITVCKKFEVEAAHFLPGYDGPCRNLHGHTYKFEVCVRRLDGDISNDMVIDFKSLKTLLEDMIIKTFDHSVLNHRIDMPTVENLVKYCVDVLENPLRELGLILHRLRIYETSDSYAEYIEDTK